MSRFDVLFPPRKEPIATKNDFIILCDKFDKDPNNAVKLITPLLSKYLLELAAIVIAMGKASAMNMGNLKSETQKQHILLLNCKQNIEESLPITERDDKLQKFNKYLIIIACNKNEPTLKFGEIINPVEKKKSYKKMIADNNALRELRPGPKIVVIVIDSHGSYQCKENEPPYDRQNPKYSPIKIDLRTEYKNIKNLIYLGLTTPKQSACIVFKDDKNIEINDLFHIELDSYLLRQIDDESIEKHFINELTKDNIERAILRLTNQKNEILTAPQTSVVYNREKDSQTGILLDKDFSRFITSNEFRTAVPSFMGTECSFDYHLDFVKGIISERKTKVETEAKEYIEVSLITAGFNTAQIITYKGSQNYNKDIEKQSTILIEYYDALLRRIIDNKVITLSQLLDAYSYKYKDDDLNIVIIDQTCSTISKDCKPAFNDIITIDIGAPISE